MFGIGTLGSLIWNLITGNADNLLKTALSFWAKKQDVDLAKLQSTLPSAEHVAIAALNANVAANAQRVEIAKTFLNNPIIRFSIGIVVAIVCVRFILVIFDSTYWWIFGCTLDGEKVLGDQCSWSIPPIKGIYGNAEQQFLLFWVVAKPVDSAVQGVMGVLQKILEKRK